jgi:hypothetical protein
LDPENKHLIGRKQYRRENEVHGGVHSPKNPKIGGDFS